MHYVKEILIAIVCAALGAIAVKFIPKFLKRFRHKKDIMSNSMSENKDYQQCEQKECSQNGTLRSDDSRPASVAIIYRSEFDYISRCIHDYPTIETGGQLFGFLTETGVPVVCYAIGPGLKANHQSAFFNQDVDYLQSTYNALNEKYGLRYIGEWHSHHQLGLAKPSGHDATTVVRGMQKNKFRHFLLCIGNCDNNYHSTLNAFTFRDNYQYDYIHAPWKIIEINSPYRPIVDSDLQDVLCHPNYPKASHGSNYILSESERVKNVTPTYNDNYWLNLKSNNLVLKKIIDYLVTYNGENIQVKPKLDSEKHVFLLIEKPNAIIQVQFGDEFPNVAPVITVPESIVVNSKIEWKFTGDIFDSFKTYYEELFTVKVSE